MSPTPPASPAIMRSTRIANDNKLDVRLTQLTVSLRNGISVNCLLIPIVGKHVHQTSCTYLRHHSASRTTMRLVVPSCITRNPSKYNQGTMVSSVTYRTMIPQTDQFTNLLSASPLAFLNIHSRKISLKDVPCITVNQIKQLLQRAMKLTSTPIQLTI